MRAVSDASRHTVPTRCAVLAVTLSIPTLPSTSAAIERTLHAFSGYQGTGTVTGINPNGTLLRRPNGALFGANLTGGASFRGTLFRLKPPVPSRTKWTLAVLHTFTGFPDGSTPNASLVMDGDGIMYGTAQDGGPNATGCGVVFKATPPASGTGTWTVTTLHAFNYGYASHGDGCNPGAGLLRDASGALYGTTIRGGVTYPEPCCGFGSVFRLKPPAPGKTRWTATILHRFAGGADGQSPLAQLTADGRGALYGTTLQGGRGPCTASLFTVGCGTVFKLTPPRPGRSAWTKTVLRRFTGATDGGKPEGQLLLDATGALYGTTYQGGAGQCTDLLSGRVIGCGTVFKLAPPAPGRTGWQETVLHSFRGPDGAFPEGGVIADAAGNLYGTASAGGRNSGGVVFKLTPPAPGQRTWRLSLLHHFNVSTSGDLPLGELVPDRQGRLYGVTHRGGPGLGGTVFQVIP